MDTINRPAKTVVHTPGPWTVCEHNWQHTSIFAGPTQAETVCQIDLEGYGVNEGNQQELEALVRANARLIAAAPELLAALKRLLDIGEQLESLQMAEAAIAKAEGRS